MIKPEDIIPIKTVSDLMTATITRLKELSFRVTNYRPGGVFYTLLEMGHQGMADLYALLKEVTPQIYTTDATGDWLDLKAAEVELYRRLAQKTQGEVIFSRLAAGDAVIIPAGTMVATQPDQSGERLVYLSTSQVTLAAGQLSVEVPVEAEMAGAAWNCGTGLINVMISFVDGVNAVTNAENWITREGTDDEADESLRLRASVRWQQLSVGGGRDAYISWAQEITGVAVVSVDDQHPRGQGSIDVIITSAAGIPSAALIDEVQDYIDNKKPLCANVLVLGPTPVIVDWDIDLYVDKDHGDLEEIEAQAGQIIDIMFQYGDTAHPEIRKMSADLGVIRALPIANLMNIEHVENVVITEPAADVPVTVRQLAVKGTVAVTAQRVS